MAGIFSTLAGDPYLEICVILSITVSVSITENAW